MLLQVLDQWDHIQRNLGKLILYSEKPKLISFSKKSGSVDTFFFRNLGMLVPYSEKPGSVNTLW